jgi:hypothetical protein
MRLAQLLEFFKGESKLTEYLEKERRPDLPASVDGNGNRTAVRMIPSFVAASFANQNKSKEPSDALEIARRGTRH